MRFSDPRFLVLLFVLTVLAGCEGGQSTKGGDHIPDDPVFEVEQISSAAFSEGINAEEVHSGSLRRFAHIGDRVNVCLEQSDFSSIEMQALQSQIVLEAGLKDRYGLQAMLNSSFAMIKEFDESLIKFSSRIELNVIWASGTNCHFLIERNSIPGFPFTHEDFSGLSSVYFNRAQLIDAEGRFNKIPVAYINFESSVAKPTLQLQYLIGQYLGLGRSATVDSFLNSTSYESSSESGWNTFEESGSINLTKDALIIFEYVLLYQDILQPEDFDGVHHYGDTLDSATEDPELNWSFTAFNNIDFYRRIGHANLRGVRIADRQVNLCVKNSSTVNVSSVEQNRFTEYGSYIKSGSLFYSLNSIDAKVQTQFNLVNDNCNLVIDIRNGDQFPFSIRNANGVYVHENTIKSAGQLIEVPIIYINADRLDFTGSDTTKKDAQLVVRHEIGHFMGLKHSKSATSIMSPAGYNSSWTTSDQAVLQELIDEWNLGNTEQ